MRETWRERAAARAFFAVPVLLLALCQCSSPAESGGYYESVDNSDDSLGPSCANAVSNAYFENYMPSSYTTPQAYNNSGCKKGFVVEIAEMDTTKSITLSWNGTVPTTAAACLDLWLEAYLFEQDIDGTWNGSVTGSRGRWHTTDGSGGAPPGTIPSGPGVCYAPSVYLGGFRETYTHKIAVSARTTASISSPTRAVRFTRR